MPHSMTKKSIPLTSQCATCSFYELCTPVTLENGEFELLDAVERQSRRIKKGEYLFHAGEEFSSLFAVRTGFFKTTVTLQDGRDQVTGFFMSGEMMGMDGIGMNRYSCDAIALEDSEVCEVRLESLEEAGRRAPKINTHFFRLFSNEIVRDQSVMLLLGNMRAEERLAAFLLNLSQRLQHRGFSASDFILRMSRDEIGSYLGLKLETVSRTLSRFNQNGWIAVDHKHIRLLQPQALQDLVASSTKEVKAG